MVYKRDIWCTLPSRVEVFFAYTFQCRYFILSKHNVYKEIYHHSIPIHQYNPGKLHHLYLIIEGQDYSQRNLFFGQFVTDNACIFRNILRLSCIN